MKKLFVQALVNYENIEASSICRRLNVSIGCSYQAVTINYCSVINVYDAYSIWCELFKHSMIIPMLTKMVKSLDLVSTICID